MGLIHSIGALDILKFYRMEKNDDESCGHCPKGLLYYSHKTSAQSLLDTGSDNHRLLYMENRIQLRRIKRIC